MMNNLKKFSLQKIDLNIVPFAQIKQIVPVSLRLPSHFWAWSLIFDGFENSSVGNITVKIIQSLNSVMTRKMEDYHTLAQGIMKIIPPEGHTFDRELHDPGSGTQ